MVIGKSVDYKISNHLHQFYVINRKLNISDFINNFIELNLWDLVSESLNFEERLILIRCR